MLLGIPDIIFAMGDSAITSMMYAIQSMPASIMFVMLIPKGQEGLMYAMLGTISNLAWTVANDIGTALTNIWDIQNDALSNQEFYGILKLEILTSFLQLFPLFFVWMLPDSKVSNYFMKSCSLLIILSFHEISRKVKML